jgi:hypothetical protein
MICKTGEVFFEEVAADGERGLFRLRYDALAVAVRVELLAGFHARVVTVEGRGADALAVVAGHARRAFIVRVPLRQLQAGGNHKAAIARIASVGGLGCICMAGRLAATMRAILALTVEGEPMPKAREVGTL